MQSNCLVRFSWDIHYSCNYRCPYCWFNDKWDELARGNLYLSVEEWMKYWNKVRAKFGFAHIDIMGGEPFLYPSFMELLKKLSAIHYTCVCTNLSFDHNSFLAKRMDPSRVRIGATFHPLFASFGIFLNKANSLKNEGFLDRISIVAYPSIIRRLPEFKKGIEQKGFNLDIQPFWGRYKDKNYPDSYSHEEKEILGSLLGQKSSIDYRVNKKSPKGKLCYAGHRYAFIRNDGTVSRCGHEYLLGNIIDANFELLNGPEPCENETCACADFQYLVKE